MATSKTGSLDRTELDKYTKHLVYKCAQIIIQSRSGETVNTSSKLVSSGTDWFNLSIRDNPEIQTEIKNIYGNCSLIDGEKVCFEISVKPSEGEETALEMWYLEATTDYCDQASRVSCSVYGHMGILLKSLLIATRAVPAYWISRAQAQNRYVLRYRIYLGMPRLTSLGDNLIRHTVGSVPSPVGSIVLHVAYRPKKDVSVVEDICGNRCRSESVENGRSEINCAKSETSAEKELLADNEMRCRSAADVISDAIQTIDACSHKADRIDQVKPSSTTAPEKKTSVTRSPDLIPDVVSIPCNLRSFSKTADDNFSVKKAEVNPEICCENSTPSETDDSDAVSKQSTDARMRASPFSDAPDQFHFVGAKSVAGHDEDLLMRLYHDYKRAPPLSMFRQVTDAKEMLFCLRNRLAQFEASAKEFDEFVNSITDAIN